MIYSTIPQPITRFLDRVLQAQNAHNATIKEPLINSRAVLLLSCRVDSVFDYDGEAMVMNFFGVYWIFIGPRSITGFFSTEEEAVMYARDCFAEDRDAISPS